MRITYKELANLIGQMTDEQLNSDVTVEIYNGEFSECFAGSLEFCNENHDSLDDNHPVILVDMTKSL